MASRPSRSSSQEEDTPKPKPYWVPRRKRNYERSQPPSSLTKDGKSASRFFKTEVQPLPQRKHKPKRKPHPAKSKGPSSSQPQPPSLASAYWAAAAVTQDEDRRTYGHAYNTWSAACSDFLVSAEAPFPTPPRHGQCQRKSCVTAELLGVCHHELVMTLRGSGMYGEGWVKKERLPLHPDKFSTRIERSECAKELF